MVGYTLNLGDSGQALRWLPAGVARCCVTSPPYFGLRDYGTGQWDGGDPACNHSPGGESRVGKTTLTGGTATTGHKQEPYKDFCRRCGARRIDQQLGMEATPDQYVANLVAILAEVWRVLADDGTLWLNVGDSYAGHHGNKNSPIHTSATNGWVRGTNENLRTTTAGKNGLKAKDLIGIPWRVALALQAAGWYLRSDVIWAKPNPMPESVTDRPTRAHEYLFLLSKRPRYYYNAAAVREPAAKGHAGSNFHTGKTAIHQLGRSSVRPRVDNKTRNRRSVWRIATRPYKGAHFATMPPDLARPCILAGSEPGDLVLDPFCGSGTVGAVATVEGRRFVGVDLNADYLAMAEQRIRQALARGAY